MISYFSQYLQEISRIEINGGTTEHSYRTPLENLLNEFAPAEFKVLQEPSKVPGSGAPDFRITNQGGAVVGYVECKNLGEDIDKAINSKQIKKYRKLSPNIILTDYRKFELLRNGQILQKCHLTNNNGNKLAELLEKFFRGKPQKIGSVKELAKALAMHCIFLRPHLESQLRINKSNLCGLYNAFQKTIYHNIDTAKFADALAQTLVYGLLMAKLKANTGEKITFFNAEEHIPQNFALIREITGFIRSLSEIKDNAVECYIHDILAIINAMDVEAVGESMSYNNKIQTKEGDPYLHFYEKFLASYDAELREKRGVYYTPPPVVRFIVRVTDDILRRDFKLDGLEDSKVTALDFAAGTGTFMLEMFRTVLGEKSVSKRQVLGEHLLKNFYGFELLIAPYVIAHLKLSQFLSDKGVKLNDEQRINVFLSNTLEGVVEQKKIKFMPSLMKETECANNVKDQDILVITGNPPYRGISQNKGEWISDLIEDYKYVDKVHFKEKKHWLQDDYVKFIRFAQYKIDQVDKGIVAIITNHAFLDNPTFRGMRQKLFTSFDHLYVLDLHGNAQKKERAPDGGKDENVFDIQQGVAISIFVKKDGLSKGVFHADMYGSRDSKYKKCEKQHIEDIKWKSIDPIAPRYLFIPQNRKGIKKYEKYYSLHDIFRSKVTGILTSRDLLCINYTEKELLKAVEEFRDLSISDAEISKRYSVRDNCQWKLTEQRNILSQKEDSEIKDICYRPFDIRKIYYDEDIVFRNRFNLMKHMLGGNLGLVSVRQVAEKEFNHVTVADKMIDFRMTTSNRGGAYFYPLYLYEEEVGKDEKQKRENFTTGFRKWINKRYDKKYSPEEILGCIYAILHSPNYRKKYAEFLRMDFPHIPFPKEDAEFTRLSKIGNELIDVHLLKRNCDGKVKLHGDKTEVVSKVKHDKGERLYFNKHQYFAPIPLLAYNFQIGGYKPLDKFLKYRKGRELSFGEITTMEKAANAIIFTMKQMQKIDKV